MITDDTLPLKREAFPKIGVSIRLPETFRDLTEEERSKRPTIPGTYEILKADTENNLSFMISVSPLEIKNERPEAEIAIQLLIDQKRVISRLTPGYQEAGLWRKEIDGHTIASLSYKSNSIENNLYVLFFLCVHKGEMVFGTFTCVFSEEAEWNQVFLMCLESLEFVE